MRKAYVVRMIADLSVAKRVAVPTACQVKLPSGRTSKSALIARAATAAGLPVHVACMVDQPMTKEVMRYMHTRTPAMTEYAP